MSIPSYVISSEYQHGYLRRASAVYYTCKNFVLKTRPTAGIALRENHGFTDTADTLRQMTCILRSLLTCKNTWKSQFRVTLYPRQISTVIHDVLFLCISRVRFSCLNPVTVHGIVLCENHGFTDPADTLQQMTCITRSLWTCKRQFRATLYPRQIGTVIYDVLCLWISCVRFRDWISAYWTE